MTSLFGTHPDRTKTAVAGFENETLVEFLELHPDLPIGAVVHVIAGPHEFRFILQSRAPRDQPDPPKFTR